MLTHQQLLEIQENLFADESTFVDSPLPESFKQQLIQCINTAVTSLVNEAVSSDLDAPIAYKYLHSAVRSLSETIDTVLKLFAEINTLHLLTKFDAEKHIVVPQLAAYKQLDVTVFKPLLSAIVDAAMDTTVTLDEVYDQYEQQEMDGCCPGCGKKHAERQGSEIKIIRLSGDDKEELLERIDQMIEDAIENSFFDDDTD